MKIGGKGEALGVGGTEGGFEGWGDSRSTPEPPAELLPHPQEMVDEMPGDRATARHEKISCNKTVAARSGKKRKRLSPTTAKDAIISRSVFLGRVDAIFILYIN